VPKKLNNKALKTYFNGDCSLREDMFFVGAEFFIFNNYA